jgi:hypothetical protein
MNTKEYYSNYIYIGGGHESVGFEGNLSPYPTELSFQIVNLLIIQ